MARTYAICNQHRGVLAVLGVFLIGSIVPIIVCDYAYIGHCDSLIFYSLK